MRKILLSLTTALLLATPLAAAEIHEVEMLNRNETGALPYAPDFLRIAPGDTVRFLATTASHNAESIEGLLPEGAEPFRTTLSQDAELTFTVPGVYGIKCTPHFAMGMVMIVVVGDVEVDAAILEGVELPDRARERFEDILARQAEGEVQ